MIVGTGREYALRAFSGAVAPDTAAGLSKGHIRPKHTCIFHTEGSLLELKRPRRSLDRGTVGLAEVPARAEITEFSRKSRQRLRIDLAKVDQRKAGRPIFATLTYPADFPYLPEIYKGHLATFSRRFARAFVNGAFHWKLEFQERGAPHFHPIFWNLQAVEISEFRRWLAQNWFEVVDSGDEKHLRAGTSAEWLRSQFGILRYVSGYQCQTDQTLPGQKVGRYWGIVARCNVPYAKAETVALTDKESLLVWRIARRFMKSVNRERRIKAMAPVCADPRETLLSGDGRRIRKMAPHLRAWKHFPKKLRLKNNDNMNLFCDATFWMGAIQRLLPFKDGLSCASPTSSTRQGHPAHFRGRAIRCL